MKGELVRIRGEQGKAAGRVVVSGSCGRMDRTLIAGSLTHVIHSMLLLAILLPVRVVPVPVSVIMRPMDRLSLSL